MAKMLLINPRKRRKSRKSASPAQLRARAAFAAKFGGGGAKRRRNPVAAGAAAARRANPKRRYGRRVMRRRNPISLGGLGLNTIMAAFKDAAVMGGGAIAMDMGYKYVEDMLPVSLKRNPGRADLGDALKALVTVVVGRALRGPTRGLSMKAATGALTVQAYNLIRQQLPASMRVGEFDLGYSSPAMIYDGSNRIGPYGTLQGVDEFVAVDSMLNEYTNSYDSPLLSGAEAEGYLR